MPKYRVVIEENIIERRVYEVEADDPRASAKMAKHLWINEGKLPKKKQAFVEDRHYTVMDPQKSLNLDPLGMAHQVHGVFDCEELEEDDE